MLKDKFEGPEAFRVGIRTAPRAALGHYPLSATQTYHSHLGMSQPPVEQFDQALSQHPGLTDLFALQGYLTAEDLDRAGIQETKEQEETRQKGQKVKSQT